MKNVIITLLILLLVIDPLYFYASNDVYLAQTNTGGATGANCANALVYTYFNNSANWSGTPTGILIGPDTTVHVCSTINIPASGNAFFFQGSGISGHPITLLWENGAILQSPAFSNTLGAVYIASNSYVTINGGTNGIIQNTSNGTPMYNGCIIGVCTSQVLGSVFVFAVGGSNHIVENLAMHGTYVHQQNSTNSMDNGVTSTDDSQPVDLTGPNDLVTHNIIDNSYTAIGAQGDSGEISFNTITATNHGIVSGPIPNTTDTCAKIHDNDISGGDNWDQDNTNAYHHDPIFLFTGANGACVNAQIYNNYIHGILSSSANSHVTAYVFIDTAGWHAPDGVSPVFPGIATFNNVFDATAGGATNFPADGYFAGVGQAGSVLANNTVTAGTINGETVWRYGDTATNVQIKNNLSLGPGGASIFGAPAPYPGANIDYNIYAGALTVNTFSVQTGNVNSFAGWQTTYPDMTGGFDLHGSSPTTASVNLNPSTYIPGAGSTAIGAATNLTSLCSTIAALCFDKAGNPRPASGPWDAGAFNGAGSPPTPTLSFTIQPQTTPSGSTMATFQVTDSDNTFSGTITLTANGCGAGFTNLTTTATAGVGNFSNTVTSASGSNCNFAAAAMGATGTISANFNVIITPPPTVFTSLRLRR